MCTFSEIMPYLVVLLAVVFTVIALLTVPEEMLVRLREPKYLGMIKDYKDRHSGPLLIRTLGNNKWFNAAKQLDKSNHGMVLAGHFETAGYIWIYIVKYTDDDELKQLTYFVKNGDDETENSIVHQISTAISQNLIQSVYDLTTNYGELVHESSCCENLVHESSSCSCNWCYEPVISPLFTALHNKDYAQVEELLENRADNGVDPNEVDENNQNALHLAIKTGCDPHTFTIILRMIDNVNAHNNDGETPLMAAIRGNHYNYVELLMDHSKIKMNVQDFYGKTVLHWAVEYDRPEILKQLLKDDTINTSIICACFGNRNTPLKLAIALRKDDCVKILQEHKTR